MVFEKSRVHIKSAPEEECSTRMPHVERLELCIFVEVFAVSIEFLLRINKLQHLSSIPPLLISLHHNSIWLYFLNEFLCSLGEHTRLIQSTHKEHLLAIEALSQVNEG